jgi:hypothetical protein
VEVSRYRPLSLVYGNLLAGLLCLAVALALDSSRWGRVVFACAIGLGVAGLVDRFVPRTRLFTTLEETQPLPLGAVDVSDPKDDILFFGAVMFASPLGVALLFHDGFTTGLGLLAGMPVGAALGSLRDSRVIKRWEAGNGRLFVEGRRGFKQKRSLYVEDPAAAALDAS